MENLASMLKDDIDNFVNNINKNPRIVLDLGMVVAKVKFDLSFMEAIICGLNEEVLMDKAIIVITDAWNKCLAKDDDACYVIQGYHTRYYSDSSGFYKEKLPKRRLKYPNIEMVLENIKADVLKKRKINDKFDKRIKELEAINKEQPRKNRENVKIKNATIKLNGICEEEKNQRIATFFDDLSRNGKYIIENTNERDFVDNFTGTHTAERLLAKVKLSKESKVEEATQNENSDFEHLKDWKENTDLDYYLSEEHWNYHVNSLLYKNLLVFHEKELGAFLDVSSDSFTQPIKDYTSLYGVLFNEAYRLCYKVITTPVLETKVANFAHQAATWKFRDLKDEDGNPIELVPNVTDLIESYHILGMANAILTISNVQKKAVNEFLIALSVYNDNGMYFCGNIHRFEQYYETYEALILANMVNGTMLRPGYDNVSRDKYLRKNVPWYEHLASKLEKEKQKEKDERTASIQEQNNNDSVVINGPVKDCTFIMTAATPTSKQKQKPKVVKPKTNTRKKPSGKPLTLKYYTHGNNGVLMRQRKRVHQVFKMWNRWGWIDEQTAIEDFDAFFEGVPKHCNITWTGNNTTILTIMLQELLKQSYFEEQTGCAARSLVEQQFGKTANSDRTRLDTDMEEKINLTLFVLDPQNHDLIFQSSDDLSEVEDIQDAALIEIFSGKLRSTKGI